MGTTDPGCYPGPVDTPDRGHREVEHTADWELEVWAPDLAGLLAEAAQGMYELMGIEVSDEERRHRRLELEADDHEQLLVSFLEELLHLAELEDQAFDVSLLEIEGPRLLARLEGGSIVSRTKEIKAVTYHRLQIQETERGLSTGIIFDV